MAERRSPARQPTKRRRAEHDKIAGDAQDGIDRDAEEARLARARDVAATKRDAAATERDRVAALRDREAELADDAADGLDRIEAVRAAHEPRRAPHSRKRATSDRVEASLDRERSTNDREAAALDRQAARTLMSAVMLSSALDHASTNADEDQLWDMSIDLLAMANFDGSLTRLSASWQRTLGYSRAELIGRSYLELVHPDDLEQTVAKTAALLAPGQAAVNFETRYRAKDGSYRWLVWSARTGSGPPVIYFVVRDVTAARTAALELQTTQELLRHGFATAAVGMSVTKPGGSGVARVNLAMRQLTGRREDELLALESYADLAHPDDADATRGAITRLLAGELEYDEAEERLLRPDGSTVWVMRSATPLRDSKGITTALFVQAVDISERKQREEILSRGATEVNWVRRIREAIDHDRVVLHSQPIIALATGDVVQHELLLRMLDPGGDLILPLAFLPAAEKYGLIEELDAWVISQAVKFAARGEIVEVNLSGASIGDVKIVAHIERELGQHGVDPAKLVFEITETALMEDVARGELFAQQVTALGCGFALDDFGPHMASVTDLTRVPAGYLKIDIAFVRDLIHSKTDRQIVQKIVTLATRLDLKTIAEGVENEDTLVLLRELGVDFGQGFHIGRPAQHDRLLRI